MLEVMLLKRQECAGVGRCKQRVSLIEIDALPSLYTASSLSLQVLCNPTVKYIIFVTRPILIKAVKFKIYNIESSL